jgi:hypothetical protein
MYQLFKWNGDGKFHRAPDGFVFPRYNDSSMWQVWFFELPNNTILPFKSFNRDVVELQNKIHKN